MKVDPTKVPPSSAPKETPPAPGVTPLAEPFEDSFQAAYDASVEQIQEVNAAQDERMLGLSIGLRRAAGATPTPQVPVALNVIISGIPMVGQILTGNYSFYDPDGDGEAVSIYEWLRNGTPIPGATAKTYSLVSPDAGKVISFRITPVSTVAPTTGLPVTSPIVTVPAPAGAPSASGVSITGTPSVGQTLTGHYTYYDPDGDPQGASLFAWLRNGSPIAGATTLTYLLVSADAGTNVAFLVTPVSTVAPTNGTPVSSAPVSIPAGGSAPSASSVTISGTPTVGQTLTGTYVYSDPQNDPEGASVFSWLRNGSPISGATAKNYVLVSADGGQQIAFRVVPVATVAPTNGSPVTSAAVTVANVIVTPPSTGRLNIENGLTNWQGAWVANGVNYAPWVNPGGDWTDANGTDQGTVPIAQSALGGSGTGSVDISGIDGDVILFGVNINSYVHIDGAPAQGFWIKSDSAYSNPFPSHYNNQILVENPGRGHTLSFDYYSTDGSVRAFKVKGPLITDYSVPTGAPGGPGDIWNFEPQSDQDVINASNLAWGGAPGRIDYPIANGGTEYGIDALGIKYVRMHFDPAYNNPLPTGGNRVCSWRLPYGQNREAVYTRWLVYMEDDVAAAVTDGVKMMGPIYNETMEIPPSNEMIAYRVNNGEPSRTNPGLYPLYKYLYDAEEGKKEGTKDGGPYPDPHVPIGTPFNAFVRTNRWVCLELGVILNTAGASDGYGEFRVNGHTAWTTTTAKYRNAPETRVNQFFVNLYHGGHGIVNSNAHYRFARFAAGSTWCGVPAELFDSYPTWRTTNTVKDTWGTVTSQTFEQGIAAAGQDPINANQINNWSGSISFNDGIYLAANGGHPPTGNPYNTTWGMDLKQNAPTWALLNPGSDHRDLGDQSIGGYNRGDYGPIIRMCIHTYYSNRFRKGLAGSAPAMADGGAHDRLFLINDSPWAVDGFDLVTNLWDPPYSWPMPPVGVSQSYAPMCVDPRDEKIIMWAGPYVGSFTIYNPATNSWTAPFFTSGVSFSSWWWQPQMVDPARNRLIIQKSSDNFSFYEVDMTTWVCSGPHTITLPPEILSSPNWGGADTNYTQLIYDPFNDRFLFGFKWGPRDGESNPSLKSLLSIDPVTWACAFVSDLPYPGVIGATMAWGIFGRLDVNKTYKCLTWLSEQWSPMMFMPLVDGGAPPPGHAPTASAVSISGTPAVGQVLTGHYTYADVDSDPQGVSVYAWLRNGVVIGGATAITYTVQSADVGAAITFRVTPVATVAPSTGSPVTSAAVNIPAPTGAPVASAVSISGTPTVGQTLTGHYTYSDPDGDPEGSSTFAWLRGGVAITGATALTYTLVTADAGAGISFRVTPVSTIPPTNGTAVTSSPVTIAGGGGGGGANYLLDNFNGADGSPLENHTADSGSGWIRGGGVGGSGFSILSNSAKCDATNLSEYHYHSNAALATADYTVMITHSLSYWDGSAFVRQAIIARWVDDANYYRAGYAPDGGGYWYLIKRVAGTDSTIANHAQTIANGTTNTVKLILQGSTIKLNVDGVDIITATDTSFIAPGKVGLFGISNMTYYGHGIYFGDMRVDANTTGGAGVPVASSLTISGTPTVGQTLTGHYTYSDPDSDPEGVSIFQWLRNASPIGGATAITYTLVTADAGTNISFRVTPVSTVAPTTGSTVTSLPVSVSAAAGAPVASSVTISGTPTVGQTLTGHYTYSDPDSDPEGVSLFAWLRNGVAISGATASTYLLVSADAGTSVAFRVTPVSTVAPTTGIAVTSAAVSVISGSVVNYVHDTFVDPDGTWLQDHVGQVGAVWTQTIGLGGSGFAIESNAAKNIATNALAYIYLTSGIPSTPDYTVTCTNWWQQSDNGEFVRQGIVARYVDDNNFYLAGYAPDASAWYVSKWVAGTETWIIGYTQTLTLGNEYVLKLVLAGTTLTLYIDGVNVGSVVDSAFSAIGRVGVWGLSSASYGFRGMFFDDISVDSNS
jgi:hypothetical protein